MTWHDRLKVNPKALADMQWQVGDVVTPAEGNLYWQPASLMIVSNVTKGQKSGMTIISAENSTGRTFTGFIGAFKQVWTGMCRL